MRLWLLASALPVLAPLSALGQQRDAEAIQLDPVGTWRCIVYGHPTFGDERVLLSFAPDQTARLARSSSEGGAPTWSPLSHWQVENGLISFSDSRTGRRFNADLGHDTLSGEWRTLNLLGGWWCAKADAAEGPGLDILATVGEAEQEPTRRLIPAVMATPTFPREAIRQAKEGRVVLCFIVEPSGEISEPEFVELSDELFRAPSLDALMRSLYKPWDPRTDGGARPACRSFIYRLDYKY